ncbi:MAG: hypothetical protein JNM29_23295 [Candidatus Odyssella sp.]|nr:hypothetical protein [Candidatus Odyssella sp.]
MHERENSGRTRDPVEEAGGGSFPASDPPAWTVARAGKPEARAGKRARRAGGRSLPSHCAVIGLFRSPSAAQAAAAALLGAGFNRVDIGPPLRFGELGGGIGARADRASAIGVLAAFGAIAAAGVAALVVPRRARYLLLAAAGGAVGAASAQAARLTLPRAAALLFVKLKSPDDLPRAFEILEMEGACQAHVDWAQAA